VPTIAPLPLSVIAQRGSIGKGGKAEVTNGSSSCCAAFETGQWEKQLSDTTSD
jgi:hypothetical protein